MINKLEVLCGTKYVMNEDSMKLMSQVILTNGLNGISTHQIWLNLLQQEKIKPQIFVNIDFPFSQYDTEARLAILDHVIAKHGKLITGFNICPSVVHIDLLKSNKALLQNDINSLVNRCMLHKKQSRLFINIPTFENKQDIKTMIDIGEQSNVGTLILGSSSQNHLSATDAEIFIHELKKSISHPFGYFGAIKDLDQATRFSKLGASIILLPTTTIFNLFVK